VQTFGLHVARALLPAGPALVPVLVVRLFLSVPLAAQTPDALEIMRRAAENAERAQAARKTWVYDQDVFVRLKRTNGKLAREESRQYTVAPTEKGARRKLVKVEGKILEGRKEIGYTKAGYRQKDSDIDGAIVDNLGREVMWRQNSMGLMAYWGPLESKNLEKYDFKLAGEEHYRDYDVYRITYREKEDSWEGEVLIERHEFQPVLLTCAWTAKVPAVVKIGLGTNVKHIGAKITYKRFDKDIWFPVQSGGEMTFRVLFLYARTVAFSGTNRDFRKTDVQSSIEFDEAAADDAVTEME
jgi:hypothetical protein